MKKLCENIFLVVLTQVITNQAITVTGHFGGTHNETYHVFQNAVSWYEAYTVCETFGHKFQMIQPYQARCLMNSLKTAYGHIHIWIGAVQPRYSENIYDVDLCEDYVVVNTDVIANNSYSVCVSLDSDNPEQYFLQKCEENNPFVCIEHGDEITTDGLFESLSGYGILGIYYTETDLSPSFEDCINYCKTRIECFASIYDSNLGDCRLMLDNSYNFMTRHELTLHYSNEPDHLGVYSVYVKTTRVHIEFHDVSAIYQDSFPCNFEYGYPQSTGAITETGMMQSTIGVDDNSKISIKDMTTQETSSKEISTTQELNPEEGITTQEPNAEEITMSMEPNYEENITTQAPNPAESTITEEMNVGDGSTTLDYNSEDGITSKEQASEVSSTTKQRTSDEIITTHTPESEEKPTTQEINSDEGTTTQEPSGDASVTSAHCLCSQVCTPKLTTKNTTIEDLQKELIIDKKTFSSYKRSLICIKDFRSSSNAIGGFAIVILSVVFGILVFSDILLLFRRKANLNHII